MASAISEQYWVVLRKHMETGVTIDGSTMTPSQKTRTRQCEEVFNAMCERPWIDPAEYLRNKYGRTQSELQNDLKIINFMASFRNMGVREIDEFRVRAAANTAMKHGAQTGNDELALKGAALLTKVAGLDKPVTEDNDADLLPGQTAFTTDVSAAYEGKRSISRKEMARIRKMYGVIPDEWQSKIEVEDADYEEIE